MKYLTPYRIATYLLVLFFLGHTAGGMLAQKSLGPESDAVFAAMKSVRFVFNGATCTWYDFWFGFGLTPKVVIAALVAFFPIVINTVHGVEQTPELLVRAAQSLGAGRLAIFWHVVIPAALPSIAAGLSIGMGVAWFAILAGEIISGQYGIGYFTWNAYSMIRYHDIIVGMLSIGVLGTLSTYAVRLATRPLLAWQRKTR
jgi:ABC-type nitrate/sulfonate/bicarbonate transport system permease component